MSSESEESGNKPTASIPFGGLLETLSLMVAQARAYESILPRENLQARSVAAVFKELAGKAMKEAQDLEISVQVLAQPPTASTAEAPFSTRERQVIKLAAQGMTNKEIAYRLGISDRTVQFHMSSVFNKTGTLSRTEAVSVSLKQGWID